MPKHPDDKDPSLGREADPTVPIESTKDPGPLQSRENPGKTIGPYVLGEQIGAGGMGEVWKADQITPVRRTVALKLMKPGMDSGEFVTRFEAERQALALMDHPCIAKVFDAGTSPSGRPYFAMEYVKGVPVTEYCDSRTLGTKNRLKLFQRVCDGVQHAHQKAILHRDLKPTNVLVTEVDGKPVPKIIDFGIAKATSQKLTDKTMVTALGQFMGTPEYMSPEQAELTGEDMDTRTDVYSLGVILYELLSGALPFDPGELRKAGFEGILKVLREQDPPRPSTRVSTLEGQTTLIAKSRGTVPRRLLHQLKGDLDWIVMRSLEKDRNRRYGSPRELSQDIDRHLNDEPVLAGPPSASYRTRKFVKRHRLSVGIAAAAFVVLVAFATTMGWQANRIAAERDRANEEAEASQQVSDFLVEMLSDIDPERFGHALVRNLALQLAETRVEGNVTDEFLHAAEDSLSTIFAGMSRPDLARELLDEQVIDRAVVRLDSDLEAQPLIKARILASLAVAYRRLGLGGKATGLVDRVLETRLELLGSNHPKTLATLEFKSRVLDEETERRGEALELARNAYQTRLQIEGVDHPNTLASLLWYGYCVRRTLDFEQADSLWTAGLEKSRQVLGEDHRTTQDFSWQLAVLRSDEKRWTECESIFTALIPRLRDTRGSEDGRTLQSMGVLANAYDKLGKYNKAIALYQEILEVRARLLGEEHLVTCGIRENLAHVYQSHLYRYDLAIPLLRRNLQVQRRLQGESHPRTVQAISDLAKVTLMAGDKEEATRLFNEAVDIQTAKSGPDHARVLGVLSSWGRALRESGFHDEAHEIQSQLLVTLSPKPGSPGRPRSGPLRELGFLYQEAGRHEEAEKRFRESLAMLEKSQDPENQWTLFTRQSLGKLLIEMGRFGEAESLLVSVLEGRRKVHGRDSHHARETAQILADLYAEMGRPDDARQFYEELLTIAAAAASQPNASADAHNDYAWLLLKAKPSDLQNPEAALKRLQAVRDSAEWLGPDVLDTIALAYHKTGNTKMAVEIQREALAILPPVRSELRIQLESQLREFNAVLTGEG